ncbi:hypothetical protein ACU686_12475 [Yinghuangia aomiensis]
MTRGRLWAAIAAAVALAIVAAGLFWAQGRDSAEAKTFCWGLIPARSLEALFPEGAFEEPRDEPLAYPRVIDERCRVFKKGARLEWFEYKLTDAYDGVAVDNLSQVGGEYLMSPLGSGLVGAASDLGGWVEVPPCGPGDAPRFFAMYARRLDAEVQSRPRRQPRRGEAWQPARGHHAPGRHGQRDPAASPLRRRPAGHAGAAKRGAADPLRSADPVRHPGGSDRAARRSEVDPEVVRARPGAGELLRGERPD